jgi:hypothetical protein
MLNTFSAGVKTNDGTPNNPAVRFLSNGMTGLFLRDQRSLGVTTNGQVNAIFDTNLTEFVQPLKFSSGAIDNAVLSCDEEGRAKWRIKNHNGFIQWNELYTHIDVTSKNNKIDVIFPSKLDSVPSVQLTKESNYPVDLDFYIKDKTSSGFTIYSDLPMCNQILVDNIGSYSACVLANNDIGICYYSATDRLMYTRDKSFTTPIIIDDVSVIDICCIKIANGNPAIAYIEDNNDEVVIKYVRAIDPIGTMWDAPVTILTMPTSGFLHNSLFLRIINNTPHLFFNNEQGRAKMIKSMDVNGSKWHVSTSISNLTNHLILDVKVINNNPAVIAKSNNGALYYVFSNTNGTSWPLGATQIFKNIADFTPMLVSNGNGHVLEYINDELCIITSEANTNSLYICKYSSKWSDCTLLATSDTNMIYPRIFKNNDNTYLLYNKYSGNPSEKNIINFKDGVSRSFINSLNYGTDHQVINNIIIMATQQGLNTLRFYDNDLVINWSAST